MPTSVAVVPDGWFPHAATKTTKAAMAATRDPIRCIELPPTFMALYLSTLLDGSNDPFWLLQRSANRRQLSIFPIGGLLRRAYLPATGPATGNRVAVRKERYHRHPRTRRPAAPLGAKSMIRIRAAPKKMSGFPAKERDPICRPASPAFSAKEGRHTTNTPPRAARKSKPHPPITTPTSSVRERPRPKLSGLMKLVTMASSEPATPAYAAESPKARVL